MASEAERDGFGGAISSAAAPAVSLWLPFWSGIEINDSWVARILAFVVPASIIIVSLIVAALIGYLCFFWTVYSIEALNRNAVPALE